MRDQAGELHGRRPGPARASIVAIPWVRSFTNTPTGSPTPTPSRTSPRQGVGPSCGNVSAIKDCRRRILSPNSPNGTMQSGKGLPSYTGTNAFRELGVVSNPGPVRPPGIGLRASCVGLLVGTRTGAWLRGCSESPAWAHCIRGESRERICGLGCDHRALRSVPCV